MSYGSELLSDLGRSGLQILSGEAIWDAGSINSAAEAVTTVTVSGASLGDYVVAVSCSLDVVDLTLTGAVTTADTVTIQLGNLTGGALNLASATYKVLVLTAL